MALKPWKLFAFLIEILAQELYNGYGSCSDGTGNALVTADQLKEFGWRDTSDAFVKKLNDALVKYGITDKNSIALFMATMAAESDYGRVALEEGKDAHFIANGYDRNTRGAGYIQITSKDTHREFLKSMNDSFAGIDTATYIEKHYALEASAWYWSKMNKTSEKNLNAYAAKYGSSSGVFLITQFFVQGFPTKDPRFDPDLRAIRDGGSFTINKNANGKSVSLGVNGNTYMFDKNFNWDKREDAYNKAIKAFR